MLFVIFISRNSSHISIVGTFHDLVAYLSLYLSFSKEGRSTGKRKPQPPWYLTGEFALHQCIVGAI